MATTSPTTAGHGEHNNRFFRPPDLRRMDEGDRKSTWLELFFDLCFVVAVGAVASELHGDTSREGALRAAGLFVIVWWAWMGYTWYATAFDSDDIPFRLTMLGAMMGVLVLATSVPGVEDGDDVPFVLAYVGMKALLVGLFARAALHSGDTRVFCIRYAGGFAMAAAIFLLSLAFDGATRYSLWALAMVIELLTPIVAIQALTAKAYDSTHIPERYGLFVLIVLGEIIVAIAASTSGASWEADSAFTAFAAFAIAAAVWWIYFEHNDASLLTRSRVTAFIWGYGHIFVFAGIVATGVGAEFGIEAAFDEHATTDAERWILCGGMAMLFGALAGLHFMDLGNPIDSVLAARLTVVAAALVVGVAGGGLDPALLLATLTAVVIATTTFEVAYNDPHREHEELAE